VGQDQLGRSSQLRVSLPNTRIRVGTLELDALSRPEAIDAIVCLVREGRGGTVFTPNVDHIVQAQHNVPTRMRVFGKLTRS
jgi:UDP-N-acetyl-D-mannosaminuronic acid transferase (WecB/TagA/CpsF family)